jgi:hypothetical protein
MIDRENTLAYFCLRIRDEEKKLNESGEDRLKGYERRPLYLIFQWISDGENETSV